MAIFSRACLPLMLAAALPRPVAAATVDPKAIYESAKAAYDAQDWPAAVARFEAYERAMGKRLDATPRFKAAVEAALQHARAKSKASKIATAPPTDGETVLSTQHVHAGPLTLRKPAGDGIVIEHQHLQANQPPSPARSGITVASDHIPS